MGPRRERQGLGTIIPEVQIEVRPPPVPDELRTRRGGIEYAAARGRKGGPVHLVLRVADREEEPKVRACEGLPDLLRGVRANFTDFYAERWDLLALGKESEHDIEYDQMPLAANLVYDLGCAGAEVEAFMMEQSMKTELGARRGINSSSSKRRASAGGRRS